MVAAAVDREAAADVLNQRPADVVGAVAGGVGARHHARQRDVVARARQRVDDVRAQHLLLGQRMRVDDRRLAGDRDRLFQRPDAQLGVHRHGRRAAEHHAITLERVESGQREGDGVRARPQIDDLVPTVAVGDHGPDLLDQHRAGGFDGHAGEHGPRGVLDGPGDRRLCKSDRRNEQEQRSREGAELPECPHT